MALGRVLVVDDETEIRKSLRLILTKAGFDVVEAEDGEQGVVAVRRSDRDAMPVDVIICDLHMPKMNGTETIAYFHSQFPSVPVIVLTGEPDLRNAGRFKSEQGVIEYLVKPVQPEQLRDAVHRATFQKAVMGRAFFAT